MTKDNPQTPKVVDSPETKTAPRAWTASITNKLTLVLLLVSLLPMALIAYYSINESLERNLQAEQRNLRRLAISTAGRLDQLIMDTRGVVNFIASDPNVIGLLMSSSEQRKSHEHIVQSTLERLLDARGNLERVYVMNKHGKIIAATARDAIGHDVSHREYYHAARRGENYISNLLVGGTSRTTGVYFSGPVRDDRGAMAGVALIKVKEGAIDSVLKTVQESAAQGEAFLVDKDGVIVSHPDHNWLYHSLGRLSPQQIEQIQAHSRFPVDTIDCLCLPGLTTKELVGATKPGNLGYRALGTEAPQVLGYAPMEESRLWTVAVSEPQAVFAAPIEAIFRQALTHVGVVGIAVLLLSLVLGRALVRPLRALTQVTQALKSGDNGETEPPPGGPSTEVGALLPEHFRLNEGSKAELARISRARRDEIGQLALAFEDMVARLKEYIENLKKVTAAKERIESEMKIAGDIQLSFLSTDFSIANARPELDLHAVVHPAKQAGGDLYDFFFVDDEHLFFVIGDVSDKGMPAALFMAVALTLIRNLVCRDVPPDQVLNDVNQALCRNNDALQFVTMFCALLHLPSGEVRYSHGGHNPPYLFSPATGELRPLAPVSGVVLGVFDSAEYKTEILNMAPGDILFTYSDGITEAMNANRELFGEPRLEACLRRLGSRDSAQDISQTVLSEITAFVGDAPQSDDITALCIRFSGKFT